MKLINYSMHLKNRKAYIINDIFLMHYNVIDYILNILLII